MITMDSNEIKQLQVQWGEEVLLVREELKLVFPALICADLPGKIYRSEYGRADRVFPETNSILFQKTDGSGKETAAEFQSSEKLEKDKTSDWPVCKSDYLPPEISVGDREIVVGFTRSVELDYYPHCDGEYDRWSCHTIRHTVRCDIDSLTTAWEQKE